jgi:hypothetical protein
LGEEKEKEEHSGWSVFGMKGVFCFVLMAAWRVDDFFLLRQCLAELMCNV